MKPFFSSYLVGVPFSYIYSGKTLVMTTTYENLTNYVNNDMILLTLSWKFLKLAYDVGHMQKQV